MALNKSKGNMYPWITHTWNPLAGECPHKCTYCSTNRLKARYPVVKSKYSGPPRKDRKQMQTNLGKNNFIFVCAQNDLFASDIPIEVTRDVLDYCYKFDNSYLFQTKNPSRMNIFELPPKSVVCTTIETNRWIPEHMGNTDSPIDRVAVMYDLSCTYDIYITIEPIMDFDTDKFPELIRACNPTQINIGADSRKENHRDLPEPSKEKVLALISELEKFTTVKQKDNLKRLLK